MKVFSLALKDDRVELYAFIHEATSDDLCCQTASTVMQYSLLTVQECSGRNESFQLFCIVFFRL